MKSLLVLLFTAGKLGKVATTAGTMLMSIVAYAFIFGWWYAAGFVLLILAHELGHYIAARQRGLEVGAPTFIPFVGAWIEMKQAPHNVETEAYVAMAGPLVGTIAALVCYYLSQNYDSRLMLALAYAGFFINLFNLIPLSPFDGGRITAILSPRMWFLGVPIFAAVFYYRPSPILILVAVLAIPQLMAAWRYNLDDPENARYYEVSLENKLMYGVFYLGLACFLAVMSHEVFQMLGPT